VSDLGTLTAFFQLWVYLSPFKSVVCDRPCNTTGAFL